MRHGFSRYFPRRIRIFHTEYTAELVIGIGNGFSRNKRAAVDADQNYDVNMRATRDGVNVDKTLRIVVKNAGGSDPQPRRY